MRFDDSLIVFDVVRWSDLEKIHVFDHLNIYLPITSVERNHCSIRHIFKRVL